MSDHYCINCDEKVPIWIRYRRVRFVYRTKPLVCEEKYAVCQFCGEEVYIPQINDWNAAARKEEIRRCSL